MNAINDIREVKGYYVPAKDAVNISNVSGKARRNHVLPEEVMNMTNVSLKVR